MQSAPSLRDIRSAASRIDTAVMNTPFLASKTLSEIAGAELFLKFENLQFTASFKERGALNKLLVLAETASPRGVCAMSAGNHAQGLAYHARRLGIPATIVMPVGTPLTKISRTRDHGAEVIVKGANLSEAMAVAQARATESGLIMVHPYDDPDVIAGQGTMGLEILATRPDLDMIVVPIGGGGLISGIAIALKALRPEIRIIGVQSSTYPSMVRALEDNDLACEDGLTIAEGIAVKTAGVLTRAIIRDLIDDIVLVDEEFLERSVALLQSVEKTVVEGAGAAGLAAVLQYPKRFSGSRVAVPLTGGNIDSRMFASVIMRELVRNGQLLRFEVPISDRPGALSILSAVLGEAGANIVDVSHDRMSLSLNPKGAVLGMVVEVQNRGHGDTVIAALRERQFDAVATPIG